MSLVLETLDRFFTDAAPAGPGDLVVVAFSGGPDSTALLHGLAELAPARDLRLLAAHLDHGQDPGSEARAAAARRLAERLGVECVAERREVRARARPGESPEAAARRVRYRFLEDVRRARGGRWIATAHHRDDQAETVLLRLLQGTGLEGLAGIQPIHGHIVRPLLDLARSDLSEFLAELSDPPIPVVDPTNRDLRIPRNRVRHTLLPTLETADPGATEALARLASTALRARKVLDRRLETLLEPTEDSAEGPVAVHREAFDALPGPLKSHALSFLERRAGAPYSASRAARDELARQLAGAAISRIGCDLAGGWRWESEGPLLKIFSDHPLPGRRQAPPLHPLSCFPAPKDPGEPRGVSEVEDRRHRAEDHQPETLPDHEERAGGTGADHQERRGGAGPRGRRTSEARPLPTVAATTSSPRRAEVEARADVPSTHTRAPFRRPGRPDPPRRSTPSAPNHHSPTPPPAPSQAEPTPAFSYTLPLPGEVEIPELGITVRVRREPVAPWMFRGSRRRAAFVLPPDAEAAAEPGAPRAVVRNRRPGDRLRPLGAPGRRKLKDVLIDRRVPRRERDRLPLLCVDGRIAWVPGVTVDEAFRLPAAAEREGGEAWTAEVIA